MANIFNDDFTDFLKALNNNAVEYLLIGGYAVILHGYIRSTADMDIWVNKTKDNYIRIKRAYAEFGAPIFPESEFLGNKKDVWAIGIEPNKIELMSEVKSLEFAECLTMCMKMPFYDTTVPYIHLKHLIQVKEAVGRFKDKADIEHLKKHAKKKKRG